MVVMPSCECGDLLLTDRTETVLLFPEGNQLPFPLEIVYHLHAEAFFKVLFPSGIVGVCFSLDFHMPFDRDVCRVEETIFYDAFFGCDDSVEDPVLPIGGFEVALLHPLFGFVGVSPFRPSPQGLEDCMADSGERDFPDVGFSWTIRFPAVACLLVLLRVRTFRRNAETFFRAGLMMSLPLYLRTL